MRLQTESCHFSSGPECLVITFRVQSSRSDFCSSISLPQQGAAGNQLSGLSPVGVLWLPAGNSWSSLQPADLDPAGSTEKWKGPRRTPPPRIPTQTGSPEPSLGHL